MKQKQEKDIGCGCGHDDCTTNRKANSDSSTADVSAEGTSGYRAKGNEGFIDYEYELQVEREKSEAVMDMARRLQADFDNYRKRNLELSRTAREDGIADAAKAFLSVFDAVMSAEKHITDTQTLEGLGMIKREFLSALSAVGVTPLEAVGADFDPNLHNAIFAEVKHKTPPNKVTEEVQKGFMRGDKVIRHAVVKISK